MEGVEGLLKDLKLSEEERKKIRIGKIQQPGGDDGLLKAFAKLLSDKEARAETIEQAVGWIWCPMKGSNARAWGITAS